MEIFKANDPILKSDTGFIKYIQIIAIDKENKAKPMVIFN